MKRTDDYTAKIDLWRRKPRVEPLPYGVKIAGLKVKRFNSYEEFNRWKRQQILKLATLETKDWQIPYDDAVS